MVIAYVQILGSETDDIDPSILLFFENKRYLFNIGESSLRFCNENKIKLGKVSNFFISSIQPETIGGLPGLLMTMDDFGKHNISITGPSNLINYIQSLRFCLLRHNLKLDLKEIKNEEKEKEKNIIHKDENIEISTIFTSISNEIKKKILNEEIISNEFDCYHNFEIKNKSKSKLTENQPNKKFKSTGIKLEENEIHDEKNLKKKNIQISQFSKMKNENTILTYICETPNVKGKFNIKKAKELGLKPGPSFSDLKNGKSILLDDGKLISPDMVLDKEQLGSILILIFCQHEEFLIPLIENKKWEENYFKNEKVILIIHLTKQSIFENEKYKKFISKFNKNCQVTDIHFLKIFLSYSI